MKELSRRSFMKGLAGITAAIGLTGKAEEPKYEVGYDPAVKGEDKSIEKYDLIADLVEEMNQFEKKFPKQYIRYFIHCNYTGLAFLNDTGVLKQEINYHFEYSHLLWIRLFGSNQFVSVKVMPMGTESDLNLISRRGGTHKNIYDEDVYTYELVTTRCFNVNRDEEGRKIAGLPKQEYPLGLMGIDGSGQPCFYGRYMRARSKEAMSKGQVVAYLSGVDKHGTPWVEPVKHKDFYKNG